MSQPATVNVTWEDQQSINTFGRLNSRKRELEEQLKEKKSEFENLDEANDELALADEDDDFRLLVGEVFVTLKGDKAQAYVEAQKDTAEKEVSSLEEEIAKIVETLTKLKVQLYGKFGKE
eukprot:CAMPEP_0174245860 /NCGR_PEP_ID=MMETSP0417-20130205/41020_1 /TAXON_ID=242541 /ORGANISM="Mayorella sp, Strain BSH-02190019" /LENGTH=119 /DNA_ID=CAMNT_0015325683 /DNA_START=51 /DNA_END=407 /DNA_ORIENTATION=-